MMADHMFESTILSKLLTVGDESRDVTLAVDLRTDNPLVDPDDATWVKRDANGLTRLRIAPGEDGIAKVDDGAQARAGRRLGAQLGKQCLIEKARLSHGRYRPLTA